MPAAGALADRLATLPHSMLAINTRLGFAPAWATIIWEIGIADARRYAEGGTA